MIISGLSAANGADSVRKPAAQHVIGAEASATGQALVCIERPMDRQASRPIRPDASFLTHLIATAMHAPQTRNLRRISPSDARAVYAQSPIRPEAHNGRIVAQTA